MKPKDSPSTAERSHPTFADRKDLQECRAIHRRYGSTYYFASLGFPPEIRRRVDALYAFVRIADEMVDGQDGQSVEQRAEVLGEFRREFLEGLKGIRPKTPVLRAFCDLTRTVKIPTEEPIQFLDAMAMDLRIDRYETYKDLQVYMAGSATVIGVMMCRVLETTFKENTLAAAKTLGEAMQLTNFLRDIGEDAARGRLYLPQEDLAKFGVAPQDVLSAKLSPEFVELMRFEIARARALYAQADPGIKELPGRARKSVTTARILYCRILDRIEALQYDVYSNRARTSKVEKLAVAGRVWLTSPRPKAKDPGTVS